MKHHAKVLVTLLLFVFVATEHNAQTLSAYEANGKITPFTQDGVTGIEIISTEKDGIAWIKGETFSSGSIEFDIMGENKPGSSFVGLVFHTLNDTTYDCVYFRPFNFLAEKQINRDHMVQYVSHPEWPWFKLREQFTGQFEKAIIPGPDPLKWLHARIEVAGEEVRVFVNNATQPALVVKKLNKRTTGQIGFWAGFNSKGRFANLKITKK